MEERNIRVVESMCATGMELDTLYDCFPDMDRNDIKVIYESYHAENVLTNHDTGIRMNCS